MLGQPDYDILAIGAHPDDIEICCGGTMAKMTTKGYKLALATTTSAELGSRGDTVQRAKEFANAARVLNAADHKMLNIPDGHVAVNPENKMKIVRIIREYRPRVIFTHHWVARHPDHQHTSELVQEAVFLAGLTKIESGQKPWRPYKTVFFANRYEFAPSFVVDISDFFEQKMNAILAYKSQFHREDMEKFSDVQTPISQPGFLEHIRIRNEQYGVYLGVKYAEPFLVRENLAIADPVSIFDEKSWFAVP